MARKLYRVHNGRRIDSGFRGIDRRGQPFWLPATSFYFWSIVLSLAVFFASWWFFENGGISETPWILSGILSTILLVAAGILREIVLRDARRRYLFARRQLDNNVSGNWSSTRNKAKLSINYNSTILRDIEKKSAAANTLKQLPDAHLEVFELCEEYLNLTKRELDSIGIGSPRLGSISSGRRRVSELHKFHLLTWAAVESGIYTEAARTCESHAEKFETADKALTVLNAALNFYPNEKQLIDSAQLVREFLVSAKISQLMEEAEGATSSGDNGKAIGFYKDALFYLAKEDIETEKKDAIAGKIKSQIDILRERPYDSRLNRNAENGDKRGQDS